MSELKHLRDASSLRDISKLLGFKPSAISYLLYKLPLDKKYKKFKISKKNGGDREINAPIESLKKLQRRLADVLFRCREEIDAESSLRPLSHGYRKHCSIVTNASIHKGRRFVLNLDIQDFFPSFNFGRVRGFFIKNRSFELNDKVATIIAQIACHENSLPQGSPCSPIIADLIAHLLDVRLVQLAKRCGTTYSRYADDLTFSTNQKVFPSSLARYDGSVDPDWTLGDKLIKMIEKTGFAVNPTKTRMQCRASRQLVTGLIVNSKVNIRPEYYRLARAMCHSLFNTGAYYRPVATSTKDASTEPDPAPESIFKLGPLEGILSHIHHVKNLVDGRDETKKKKEPTSARTLYARFLVYRYFVALNRPVIVCEGKTDKVYLKYAIQKLNAFHPKLGTWSGSTFESTISFFNYTNQAHSLLRLDGGTGDLKIFMQRYKYLLGSFTHRPLKCPVIILIDNDEGAKAIFSMIKENFSISVDLKSADLFFHLSDNLYLVKTPDRGSTGKSCIENFFDPSVLATRIAGEKFNPAMAHGAKGEYGKVKFAEKVVRPNADKIDFINFTPLLDRIVAVIDHYSPPALSAFGSP